MKKILLVSSSAAFLERNANLLKRTDCKIFTATNGADAIAAHEKEQVNLVISEIQLDDMGGDQLCTLVQNSDSLRNVVFIIACRDNQEELTRAENSGAHLLITKPIQPMQLLTTVEQILSLQMVRSRRVHLRVKVLTKKGTTSFSCISNDISITGMLIETDEFLDWSDRIVCQFQLPGGHQIEVEGEVVRSVRKLDGEHQYGIQFRDITMITRNAINEYVSNVSQN
jgi:CheY-like chemotaxis protein